MTIPNTANGYKVVKIGKCALQGVNGMKTVTIPNTVTSIDELAFQGCGLTSFVLPKNVTYVGRYALSALRNVTSVKVEEGNTKYDSRDNCNAIIESATNILQFGYGISTIPASVKELGVDAFFNLYDCTLTIPSTITKISELAFAYNSNLTVTVESTTPLSINENVFQGLSNSTLRVPAGSKSAYAAATGWKNFSTILEGNEGSTFTAKTTEGIDMVFTILDESENTCQVGYIDGSFDKPAINKEAVNGSLTIPNIVEGYTVVKIGKWALNNVDGMTSITIPNTVTSFDDYAFHSCDGLESFELSASVTSLGTGALSAFGNVTSLTVAADNPNYESPEGSNAIIEKSSKTLIAGCNSTIIPSDVKVIGAYVFNSCNSMASITIPASIESIGDYAFGYCNNLTSVTVEAVEPLAINETVFSGTNTNATLYVPAGSKAAYEAADYWKEFKEIIEVGAPSGNIVFANDKVKAACVAKWDTDKDGELSYDEAAVTSLVDKNDANDPFGELWELGTGDSEFSFDEFQYFTGVTSLAGHEFECTNLTSIILPNSITSIGDGTFVRCKKLTSIHIPASVTYIHMGDKYLPAPAFNSEYLQTITVDPENTKYASPAGSNAIIDTESNTLILGCGNKQYTNFGMWKHRFH